ncbi:topoisomerase DNA-binding C4 zinc finger domain-containing protein [Desulfobacca acetoxidans]|uniref:DNA topoisomerase type IA zn finger domain protein n=1 Tax=Desulfobacca acetoxidans (strain ATCC 700848 / DSM 11109 / ASRB2) TaxID=880072 RepID=F2ND37_DESAR|nr:topoisomerase DNA-binding C4 zinc finger domain-containing protein [Desulfobacca acetoxidans]AEB09761.1 DNA topoisomerase type IA zn finger domain protein [Desulfobacca acetoxidans DSM 11109]
MVEPKCPKCNSPMVLRTARRGIHAGNKFYGCSRYPSCKGTMPFEHDGSDSVTETAKPIHSRQLDLPRTLIARSKFKGYQVRFLESVAVPSLVLEKMIDDSIGKEFKLGFSQLRIDYPSQIDQGIFLTERERQLLSVTEKILTRGRVTLCSPF